MKMLSSAVLAAIAVLSMTGGSAQTRSPHMPMTNPGGMLKVHEQQYGHSVSFVELADGRILMTGVSEFRVSEDLGMTWSAPYRGKDEKGNTLSFSSFSSLVRLSGKEIGLAHAVPTPNRTTAREWDMLFRRSADEGRTWSAPVVMNPRGPTAVCFQDVFLRTSSGRIILPVYLGLGKQGHPRPSNLEGAPILGAYLNGNFISTNTHFYDPSFCASYVFYSDDDGLTWKRNRDGELFIVLDSGWQTTAEPSVTEVSPGKLLMFMRTRVGRFYQSWSYNNGETWTQPKPTHIAGTQVPAQLRTFRDTGHLLCIFNQQSTQEIKRGFISTRLSTAVSRNGGRVWELFQNLESIHEEAHVEPGPIEYTRPAGRYSFREDAAYENDAENVVALPVGWGYWSYPSVLVLKDRVLISHTHSWFDETATHRNAGGSRLKVLPIRWFYGGRDPYGNPMLEKLKEP